MEARVPVYTESILGENIGCTILEAADQKLSFLVVLRTIREASHAEGCCRVVQSIEAMRSNWNDIRKGRMSFLVGTSAVGPSQAESTAGDGLDNSARFERAKQALSAHLTRRRHQSGRPS